MLPSGELSDELRGRQSRVAADVLLVTSRGPDRWSLLVGFYRNGPFVTPTAGFRGR